MNKTQMSTGSHFLINPVKNLTKLQYPLDFARGPEFKFTGVDEKICPFAHLFEIIEQMGRFFSSTYNQPASVPERSRGGIAA